jgi:hypothetical protein
MNDGKLGTMSVINHDVMVFMFSSSGVFYYLDLNGDNEFILSIYNTASMSQGANTGFLMHTLPLSDSMSLYLNSTPTEIESDFLLYLIDTTDTLPPDPSSNWASIFPSNPINTDDSFISSFVLLDPTRSLLNDSLYEFLNGDARNQTLLDALTAYQFGDIIDVNSASISKRSESVNQKNKKRGGLEDYEHIV